MIRTSRLLLRQWRETDRDAWAVLNADAEVRAHFPATLTRAESDAQFDRFSRDLAERDWGLWAVDLDGNFLGFTGLAVPGFDAPFLPSVEIGWRLSRSAWGHGYATEAARAVLEYAFRELGLPELVSFTALTNRPSIAVMERIGMLRESEFEHPSLTIGHRLRPHVLYRVGNPGA